MKYLIKPVLCIAAVIAFILVANGTMKWFLNNAKDVAMDRTVKSVQHGQKTMPPKENPAVPQNLWVIEGFSRGF